LDQRPGPEDRAELVLDAGPAGQQLLAELDHRPPRAHVGPRDVDGRDHVEHQHARELGRVRAVVLALGPVDPAELARVGDDDPRGVLREAVVQVAVPARRLVADRERRGERGDGRLEGRPRAVDVEALDPLPVLIENLQGRAIGVNIQSDVVHASLLSVEAFRVT
jgi:hypothetical protein